MFCYPAHSFCDEGGRIVSQFIDIPRMSRLMIIPIMRLMCCWVVASFARLIMSSIIPIIRSIPEIV